MRQLLPKNQKGFGVIDVIIAISMTAIVFVSISSLLDSIHRVDHQSEMKEKATAYAKQSLEIVTTIQNQTFACVCPSAGNDDCTTTPGHCIKTGNPQRTCTLLNNYQSCWTQSPTGTYHLESVNVSGNWQWQLVTGEEPVSLLDPAFKRRMVTIANLCHNSTGRLVECSINEDPTAKKVTVTVSWDDHGQDKTITWQTILTAWKNITT